MDFRAFDRARRQAGPLELDLVESYAKGAVTRREFVRRGDRSSGCRCPSSAPSSRPAAATATAAAAARARRPAAQGTRHPAGRHAAPARQGGTIKVASQKPAGPLDPIAMQDLGTLRHRSPSASSSSCTLGDDGDIAPGLAESWEPNDDGSGVDVQPAPGRQVAGRHATSRRPTSPPRMDRLVGGRQRRPQGRHRRRARSTPPTRTSPCSRSLAPNGNFPYLVSVFNAQSRDHAGRLRDRHDARRVAERHRPVEADAATTRPPAPTFERNADWWGGQTPLDGSECSSSTTSARWSRPCRAGEVDAHRPVLGRRRRRPVQRPRLQRARLPGRHPPPDLDALRHGPVRRQAGPPGAGLHVRPRADDRDAVQGQGRPRQRPRDRPVLPVLRRRRCRSATQDIDKAKAAARRRRRHRPSRPTLHFGDLQEIPQLAQLIQARRRRGRLRRSSSPARASTRSTAPQWCPADPADPPCSGAAELGIVDYGHRPRPTCSSTPRCRPSGVWNSSQYSSPEFDAAFKEYQAAVGVDAQTAACKKIERSSTRTSPIGVPYFYNYLSGYSKKFAGRPGLGARADVPRQGRRRS